MLNLTLLEEKLDKALANETAATLSSWLLNKRLKEHSAYFENGNFEEVKSSFNRKMIEASCKNADTSFTFFDDKETKDLFVIPEYSMAA